jgi:type IV secretory pathway component VirB8
MPDEDLQAAIDRMASSSQARGNAIGYYIAEWDRRMQRRLNRTLLRLTWVIALLTVLLAMLAVIELISR